MMSHMVVLFVWIAPSSFIMCDMLSGSVERIVSSSRLLLFLERVRILNWIIQRRQKSYNVHTQVATKLLSLFNCGWCVLVGRGI